MTARARRWLVIGVPILVTLGCGVSEPLTLRSSSVAEPNTTKIDDLKAKVALATRMLALEGLFARNSGHVSTRIPGTDHVLIGPFDVSREILSADDIVTVDLNSRQLAGTSRAPNEVEIHTGIYRARPDVQAVVHTHALHSTVFSITNDPIVPVHMHGAIFADGVPVFDYVGHVNAPELGDALAQTLGSRRAALLKMHGAVIVGGSLEEAVVAAIQLEGNAEKQLWVQASSTLQPMSAEDVERTVRQSWAPRSIQKRWDYYRDREGRLTVQQTRR